MRFMRSLHKWGTLIVGVQLGIWLVSGLIMSLLDPRAVSGEDIAAVEPQVQASIPDGLVGPAEIIRQFADEQIRSLEFKRQLGRWVWRVESDTGVSLWLAATGQRLTIDEKEARRIAFEGYFGEGKVVAATLLTRPTIEARKHPLPIWRIDYDDRQRTRYYIGTDEGRILERRNATSSLFDFVWMLHTMDYVGRDDFNTPWVIAASALAFLVTLSGIVLLIRSLAPRRTL